MGEEESASADLERLCQGISLSVGACTYPATVRCTSCKKWFCDAHAEDGNRPVTASEVKAKRKL